MSTSFSVDTESLTSAAVMVAAGDLGVDDAHASLGSAAGALDGTPVADGYAVFLGSAEITLQSLRTASTGLSQALNMAAYSYRAADQAVAAASTRAR